LCSDALSVERAEAGEAAESLEHARAASGGWLECERGFVMTSRAGGYECTAEAEPAARPSFEQSALPSAGDGARIPDALPVYVPQASSTRSGGWTHVPPQFSNQGGELVRPNGFGRAHVSLPFPW
jgi:hypothetical protein